MPDIRVKSCAVIPAPPSIVYGLIADTFTVDGQGGGQTSLVTIATRYAKRGPAGWIERLLAPRFLRKVFAAELELLSWQVRAQPAGQAG
jgi:hypothetical protein